MSTRSTCWRPCPAWNWCWRNWATPVGWVAAWRRSSRLWRGRSPELPRSGDGFLLGHGSSVTASDLLVGHILDVGADPPHVAGRVAHAGTAVAIELVGRLHHRRGPGSQRRLVD